MKFDSKDKSLFWVRLRPPSTLSSTVRLQSNPSRLVPNLNVTLHRYNVLKYSHILFNTSISHCCGAISCQKRLSTINQTNSIGVFAAALHADCKSASCSFWLCFYFLKNTFFFPLVLLLQLVKRTNIYSIIGGFPWRVKILKWTRSRFGFISFHVWIKCSRYSWQIVFLFLERLGPKTSHESGCTRRIPNAFTARFKDWESTTIWCPTALESPKEKKKNLPNLQGEQTDTAQRLQKQGNHSPRPPLHSHAAFTHMRGIKRNVHSHMQADSENRRGTDRTGCGLIWVQFVSLSKFRAFTRFKNTLSCVKY